MISDQRWFKTIFLKHIKRGKFPQSSFVQFLVSIFRLDKRVIHTLTCKENVELRGAVWVDSKPVDGLIDRRVLKMKAGQPAWLRIDEDETFVTLENSRGTLTMRKADWYGTYKKYFDLAGY